jgi:hypothetical protein
MARVYQALLRFVRCQDMDSVSAHDLGCGVG